MGRTSVGVMLCLSLMACQEEPTTVVAAAQSPQTSQEASTPTKHKGASRTPTKPIEIQEPRDPHYEAYKAMVGVIVKLAPVHRK